MADQPILPLPPRPSISVRPLLLCSETGASGRHKTLPASHGSTGLAPIFWRQPRSSGGSAYGCSLGLLLRRAVKRTTTRSRADVTSTTSASDTPKDDALISVSGLDPCRSNIVHPMAGLMAPIATTMKRRRTVRNLMMVSFQTRDSTGISRAELRKIIACPSKKVKEKCSPI